MSFKDVMHKPVNCKWCGKEFVPTSCKNIFCCKQCHQKWKNDVSHKKKKQKPKEKKKSNHELIVDVDKEAKANGMTYGQWVALLYQQSNRRK